MAQTGVVYKYSFPHNNAMEGEVFLPEGARVLSALEITDGFVWFWAFVPNQMNAPQVKRKFFLVGTGHYFEPEGAVHIATVMQNSGYMKFVWHLFERVTS